MAVNINYEDVCFGGIICDNGNEINRRFLKWNGADIESFANSFNNEELDEMDYWAYNYGCYQPSVNDEFPNLEYGDDGFQIYTDEAKKFVIQCYIRCSLMMAIYGCISINSGSINQKELVTHFYNLMLAVNGIRG